MYFEISRNPNTREVVEKLKEDTGVEVCGQKSTRRYPVAEREVGVGQSSAVSCSDQWYSGIWSNSMVCGY